MLETDWKFWAAILGGAILSVIFGTRISWLVSAANFTSGVFIALIFHIPVLSILKWDPEIFKLATIATLAATGSDIVRMVLNAIRNPLEYLHMILPTRRKNKK